MIDMMKPSLNAWTIKSGFYVSKLISEFGEAVGLMLHLMEPIHNSERVVALDSRFSVYKHTLN